MTLYRYKLNNCEQIDIKRYTLYLKIASICYNCCTCAKVESSIDFTQYCVCKSI